MGLRTKLRSLNQRPTEAGPIRGNNCSRSIDRKHATISEATTPHKGKAVRTVLK